ncbi:IclR family transcriptional regulator [Burkholderia gladioli]|uniref:IclR family transcriptional regulator n=1 Tax=Burkholderia gladioli TaxID=28095 RepID=UPI000F52DCC5|nr:IclR family transcriptional regulator [Burkholderia gladioli]
MPDKPTDVPAIARVHDILEALKTSRRPTSAKDLLTLTGMPRSTLYLTLEALERRQWLIKIGDGYAIGVALFEIGSTYLLADFTLDAFRREAAWFVAKHNEAVQMAVLDRAEVVYLAREDPSRAVRLVSDIGSRLPAHCSALGKALLASLDDETVQMIMPARLRALTEHSLTRRADLLAALAEVRERAYAIEREEACTGLACLAVFVGVSSAGKRIAISTSVPVDRLTPQRETRLLVDLTTLAQRVARGL